jgi:hypothetical protein
MSLTQHRPSPSTVQFTYSLQPRPSTSIPSISTIADLFASFVQSTFILLLAQCSTIRFDTNRVFGPVLRYLRHLVPYNDLRLVHTSTTSTWHVTHVTPLGIISILCLAFFLFFSKATPIGISSCRVMSNSRGVVFDYAVVGCTSHYEDEISFVESFAIYSRFTNR